MASSLIPINLTARAESLLGRSSGLTGCLLAEPGLQCDQLDALGLQKDDAPAATHDEIYFIVAGQGGVRCADCSLIEVTAGDVLYVGKGTTRHFENLSRKFLTLRLLLFPQLVEPSTNPG